MYLDGGFGVGKTHLLASLWHAVPGPKRFGTFVEYTNLVGALGFRSAVESLKGNRLVCIDEFELDDPGDTVLMSTLLGELVESGVRLAATSNTLPDKLGEGRFAADDFLREIQRLSAHFDVLRIDGEDYRHRGLPAAPEPLTDDGGDAPPPPRLRVPPGTTSVPSCATWRPSTPRATGPSSPGSGSSDSRACAPSPTRPRRCASSSSSTASTTGTCRSWPVASRSTGSSPTDMLRGGYRKKYFRAVSRLVSLARDGQSMVG